jgi:Ca2+-binding RTX toxin-like protein
MTSRSARWLALTAPRTRSLAFGLLATGLLLGAAAAVAEAKQPKVQIKITGTTLVVTGTRNADAIVLKLRSGDPTVLQVIVDGHLEGTVDRSRFTQITADGAEGADTIEVDEANGVFTTTEATTLRGGSGGDLLIGDTGPLTLDGGADADTLQGGDGADVLIGGDGPDAIDGNRGNDTAFGGIGDDVFTWDPGDGSDTLEGQGGADTLRFHGANVAESFGLAANGGRLRLTRNVATIVMDVDDVERIELGLLGGADLVTVDDLSATDVTTVAADLAGVGGIGDGALDAVTVNGTDGPDSAALHAAAGTASIVFGGLTVTATEPEAGDTTTFDGLLGDDHATYAGTAGADALGLVVDGTAVRASSDATTFVGALAEHLDVSALGGPDTISAGNGIAVTGIALTLDGGADADTINGGDGADVLIGGDGSDLLDGNRGNDTAFGGTGDDTFTWDPGDGSDTLEGQDGADTLAFHGANISEKLDLAANGGRLRLTRDVASIVMDVDGVETVALRALGGADLVTVDDLSATDVGAVQVDLGASGGGGDAALDSVVVHGTAGDDSIAVSGSGTSAAVSGLAATVSIANAEFANDSLDIETDAGSDTVDASGLDAGVIQLLVDGAPV